MLGFKLRIDYAADGKRCCSKLSGTRRRSTGRSGDHHGFLCNQSSSLRHRPGKHRHFDAHRCAIFLSAARYADSRISGHADRNGGRRSEQPWRELDSKLRHRWRVRRLQSISSAHGDRRTNYLHCAGRNPRRRSGNYYGIFSGDHAGKCSGCSDHNCCSVTIHFVDARAAGGSGGARASAGQRNGK